MNKLTAEEIMAIETEFTNDFPMVVAAVDSTTENLVKLELMPEAIIAGMSVAAAGLVASFANSRGMTREEAHDAIDKLVTPMKNRVDEIYAYLEQEVAQEKAA